MAVRAYRGRVFIPLPGLARVRAESGMSQYKLSDDTGISRMQIWRLEKGRTGAEPPTMFKLAKALGVEPDELTRGPDDGSEREGEMLAT